MDDIWAKTLQLAIAFLGDQLVASLLANQTNQVEYTLNVGFQLLTKSKNLLSDALAVGVWQFGGGSGGSTLIIKLTQPSFTGTWAYIGKKTNVFRMI